MEYKSQNWTSQHETYMWDENILDEINGRSDITDEKMHELADVVIETILKNQRAVKELNLPNIYVISIPKEKWIRGDRKSVWRNGGQNFSKFKEK